MKKYVIVALGVFILAFIAWYFYAPQNIIPSSIENNFSQSGIMIKDNPGFKPGVWFLSYEKPGSPGLSVELDLTSVSTPYTPFSQGERVHIEGVLHGEVVRVDSITPVSEKAGAAQ